jgi:hypothetical protein
VQVVQSKTPSFNRLFVERVLQFRRIFKAAFASDAFVIGDVTRSGMFHQHVQAIDDFFVVAPSAMDLSDEAHCCIVLTIAMFLHFGLQWSIDFPFPTEGAC